jgi:hypothetical protein
MMDDSKMELAPNSALREFINREANDIFVAGYAEDAIAAGKEADLMADALGIRISQMLSWTGEDIEAFILRIMVSALEDSNFHRACEKYNAFTEQGPWAAIGGDPYHGN